MGFLPPSSYVLGNAVSISELEYTLWRILLLVRHGYNAPRRPNESPDHRRRIRVRVCAALRHHRKRATRLRPRRRAVRMRSGLVPGVAERRPSVGRPGRPAARSGPSQALKRAPFLDFL